MKDIFQFGKYPAYELENGNHLKRTNIQTVSFRSKSIKILEAKILDLSSGDKSIQISHYFHLKDKELDSREMPLSPLENLYWPSWFHELTFTF